MKKQSGFSLMELAIVVVIIALIAAVAIPNLLRARRDANEAWVIAAMRDITSCQKQVQAGARIDIDKDGVGEFAMLRELSGSAAIRNAENGTGGTVVLSPPALSRAFRAPNNNNEVYRYGYLFKIFLPGVGGKGVGETAGTGEFTSPVITDLAETSWCCYAWPTHYGNTGLRTFFVNQDGNVTATERETYTDTGAFTVESAGSAFQVGGAPCAITGRQAIGTVARDGQRWKQVNTSR